MWRKRFLGLLLVILFIALAGCGSQTSFTGNWPKDVTRVWVGPDYWANRLQDWRIKDGRLECIFAGNNRNVHILTRQLDARKGSFTMSVALGISPAVAASAGQNWVGFLIGARGQFNDYRDSAIYGQGLHAGINTAGKLFIGNRQNDDATAATLRKALIQGGLKLVVSAKPAGEKYRLTLSAIEPETNKALATIVDDEISPEALTGNLALVSHFNSRDKSQGDEMISWFSNWQISGKKIVAHPEQTFGPILFSQYTLSRNILKLTAQMAPVGEKDDSTVRLQIKKNGKWQTIGESAIDPLARTATFRIENWDAGKDTPYRLTFQLFCADNKPKEFDWRGTIRKEPVDKEEIVVAGFTGNNDIGFPHNDIVKNVKYHDPDLLFFSGDQIYERVAGYGVQRSPLDKACLDYLRKWYLYGWAYRDLLKDRPTVAIPDDHDVYHGNIWGAGGKATPKGLTGAEAQDMGGYKMPPQWVNMVQRTQTSHLPDPYDPTPVQQGIGVYYCAMNYAGISFAILEDRKFKSPPKVLLPKAKVWNGFAQNKYFDPVKEGDVPGAELLGKRQENFLHDWAQDWSHNALMKVVLSQTVFACVQTLPKSETTDQNVPKLRVLKPGEYPPDDQPVSDMDSNGWPQSARNRALREMRRGFAFHLAGDQHLGFTIQYGIDDWHDAGYAFCVPAISNVWPRRWMPQTPGKNRAPGAPEYTGDFFDGFGNKITVYAASNPYFTGKKPSILYDRATGYGIVRFNRNTRQITMECWPRWVDASQPDAKQYPGWPITISYLDNYARKPVEYLPTLKISGMPDPVVQVVDMANNDIVYTLRIRGNEFTPPVFKHSKYKIRVGELGTEKEKVFEGVLSAPEKGEKVLRVGL